MNEFAASLQKFPVTIATCLLAIAATLSWWAGGDVSAYVMDDSFWAGEIWRPLTTALPHASVFHLLFNIYWVFRFGALVEEEYGSAKTAGFFIGVTAATSLCSHAVMEDGIGLSGLGYALFGLLWTLRRRDTRFIGAIDDMTVFMFVGWFFLCILLTWAEIMNIGNFAHFMGAVFGIVSANAVGNVARHKSIYASAAITLVLAGTGGSFSRGSPVAMEYDLSTSWLHPRFKSKVLAHKAAKAIERGDFASAVPLLDEAAVRDPWNPGTLVNLGIALEKTGNEEEAFHAYLAAVDNPEAGSLGESGLYPAFRFLSRRYFEKGNFRGAVRYLRKMLDVRDADAVSWFMLGACLEKTGDADLAARAFRRASSLDESNTEYRAAFERTSKKPD